MGNLTVLRSIIFGRIVATICSVISTSEERKTLRAMPFLDQVLGAIQLEVCRTKYFSKVAGRRAFRNLAMATLSVTHVDDHACSVDDHSSNVTGQRRSEYVMRMQGDTVARLASNVGESFG